MNGPSLQPRGLDAELLRIGENESNGSLHVTNGGFNPVLTVLASWHLRRAERAERDPCVRRGVLARLRAHGGGGGAR